MSLLLCVKYQGVEASHEITVVTGILKKILRASVWSLRVGGSGYPAMAVWRRPESFYGTAEPSTFLLAACPTAGDTLTPAAPTGLQMCPYWKQALAPFMGPPSHFLGCWEMARAARDLMGWLKEKRKVKLGFFSWFSWFSQTPP